MSAIPYLTDERLWLMTSCRSPRAVMRMFAITMDTGTTFPFLIAPGKSIAHTREWKRYRRQVRRRRQIERLEAEA